MKYNVFVIASAALVALLLSVSAFACQNHPSDTGMGAGTGAGAGVGVAVPTTPSATQPTWTTDQLLTMTVSEAWQLSGRNYGEMSRMTTALISLSAQKRGIVLPDTVDAGCELGALIRQRVEADPNQLLYVAVDSALRDYAALHAIR